VNCKCVIGRDEASIFDALKERMAKKSMTDICYTEFQIPWKIVCGCLLKNIFWIVGIV